MITFSLKSFRISLTFGFFFILAVTSTGDSLAAASLLFCVLHELGHLFAMRLLNVKPSEIRFYGAGISITTELSGLSRLSQAIIYLSGPAVNLALAAALNGDFRAVNLCLAVMNLLPVPYFDGGRLLALLLPEKSLFLRLAGTASLILLGAISAMAVFSAPRGQGPAPLITLIFIAMSLLLDGQ